MKIVIAPDSFKESLTSEKAAEAIQRGISRIFPRAEIVSIPLADGGEGTVDVLVKATKGKLVKANVHDPLMRKREAYYGILGDGTTAVIEVAAASGLALLKRDERNPLQASSYGTGELIMLALKQGCQRIIVGLGGSAVNDGGAGLMMALGARIFNQQGAQIEPGGEGLLKAAEMDVSSVDSSLFKTEFIVACDVSNPLLGEMGASSVFGPQKGATPEMISILDKALTNYANLIQKVAGKDIRNISGTGAAGGIGASLLAFFKTRLMPGFSIVSEFVNFETIIEGADLLITGEGKTDLQTLSGKVPFGVAQAGKKNNIPVWIFTGMATVEAKELYKYGVTSIIPIQNGPMTLHESITDCAVLLEATAERTARVFNSGQRLKL